MKLLHLTDPHFGTSVAQQSSAIIDMAKELAPDFTLISGDFSMRARKREMQAARAWLDQLPSPQMTIPGNHDVPLLNQPIDRFFRPFRRYKKYINPELETSAELPVGRIIGFNSSTPFGLHIDWSRGFLSPMECNRIATGFDDMDDRPDDLRIVTLHHPIHRADDSTRVLCSPAPLIKTALASAKADILLCGHFHQSYIDTLDLQQDDQNIIISQASTACSHRTKGEPAGFHFLDLEKNQITIHQYTWNQDQFQKSNSTTFQKQNNRWLIQPQTQM